MPRAPRSSAAASKQVTTKPKMKMMVKDQVTVVEMQECYKKYNQRECRIENICGRFPALVDKRMIEKVIVPMRTCMGVQEDVYNIFGNGAFMAGSKDCMLFKGCQNHSTAMKLAADIGLKVPTRMTVNMIVISACMGELIDISPTGIMQNILKQSGITPRYLYEHYNAIRFTVSKMYWACPHYPRNNDWTITLRGSVIIRTTWNFLTWNEKMETELLQFCNLMLDDFRNKLHAYKEHKQATP